VSVPLTLARPAWIQLRASVREPRPDFESTRSSVFSGRFPGARLDSVAMPGIEDRNAPVTVRAGVTVPRLARVAGAGLLDLPVTGRDADFVRTAHTRRMRAVAGRSGVLGVPFVRCLSSRALDSMLRAGHFHPAAARGVGGPWMQVAARAA